MRRHCRTSVAMLAQPLRSQKRVIAYARFSSVIAARPLSSICPPIAAYRGGSRGIVNPQATSGSVWTSRRWAASYPNPSKRVLRQRSNKKTFNYLTTARMVEVEKTPSRSAIRERDDVHLSRRRAYKRQLRKNVEEKIRFYPPLIKRKVFFPYGFSSSRLLLFSGNRYVGLRLTARILSMIIEELCKRENRPVILEQLQELGIESPSEEEWAQYTDPETGDINIGIRYSEWTLRRLSSYCSLDGCHDAQLTYSMSVFPLVRGYILRNFHDRRVVPSLEDWSRQFGPVSEGEFVRRGSGRTKSRLALIVAKREIEKWGSEQVQAAVARLSEQEQLELLQWTEENWRTEIQKLQKRHVFCTKVLMAARNLPEIKAIQHPSFNYNNEMLGRQILERRGSFKLPVRGRKEGWARLPEAERTRFFCFGLKRATPTSCGRKLYLRICCRDYGLTLAEASSHFLKLTDLQRAALEFPFYAPISPRRASRVAFLRFYAVMRERYGLSRSTNMSIGNRLFEAAMRKKWYELSEEERQGYEDRDNLQASFPLLPTSSSTASSAPAAGSASTPATMTNHVRPASSSSSPPLESTLHLDTGVHVAPQYFVEEPPPSFEKSATILTKKMLLKELIRAAEEKRRRLLREKKQSDITHASADEGVTAELGRAPLSSEAEGHEKRVLLTEPGENRTKNVANRVMRGLKETPRKRQAAVQVILI